MEILNILTDYDETRERGEGNIKTTAPEPPVII